MLKLRIIFALLLLVSLIACKKELMEVFKGFEKPNQFPATTYNFASNPITRDGFLLGKKLFYDTKLSANNTISCGSCHQQSAAFSHHGHDVSHGIFDRLGTRNAQGLFNLAWRTHFMADGGVFNLDLQPIAPIENPVEMDETLQNVLNKLKASNDYPALFKKVYGSTEITTARMLKSLSQFMTMLVSGNSKYDCVKQNLATFSTIEQQGYTLVQNKCGTCHVEPLFMENNFRNNGLPISTINDKGRYEITLRNEDKYKFQVLSLRNLSYTAPYMHDGRFYSLDAVLDHYSTNAQNTLNIDPVLVNGNVVGIPLSYAEKEAIKAFLKTLDDENFIRDKRFGE